MIEMIEKLSKEEA